MKRLLIATLCLSLAIPLLAHCGGAPGPEREAGPAAVEQTVVETVEVEKEVTLVETVEVEVEAPPAEEPEASEQVASAGANDLAPVPKPRAQRMIIKNAEMELLVPDTDAALDSVTLIASDYGGYIISSHSWYENDYKYATVRLGVPVEEFENILRRLRGLALRVINEIASGEDVTDQFVDLQSRLTNLEATRDRIREFLDKADTVEEALEVNDRLSEVEGQIEEIQGRMNYLKDRAAYSTIDVQLNPEIPTPTPSPTPTVTPTATPTPTPTPEAWRPGETVKGATDVLVTITKGFVDVVIWVLIVLGPFLLVIALIAVGVVWWNRRRPRRAPTGKPTAPSQEAAEPDKS